MPDSPSYVGVLSAIATGEGRGYRLLSAWSARTPDPELARVLLFVALRSREHAAVFARRLCELGFEHNDRPCSGYQEKLAMARSTLPDVEKFRRLLGYGESGPAADPLHDLLGDRTIDIETGAIIGRYIATERDNERRLRAAYNALRTRCPAPPDEPHSDELDNIYTQLDRLTQTIEELKALTHRQ